MKPRKRIVKVAIEWAEGLEYCNRCPFENVMGYGEPCKSCCACDFRYHPVIKP